MATKVAQGTGTNDAAGTTLAASAVSVLKGDIICAQVGFEAVAGTAFFSDGSANVWPSPNTPTTTQDNAAVLFGRTGWTRVKVDNAALIVTANTPNGTFRDITLLVFRPAAGMQLTFRTATSAQGSSTALASGAITTAPGATAGFYLWESGGTFTISGGFTAQNSSSGDTFDGYQLGTSGSQNATASGTISTRWVAHILNFVETPLIAAASRQRSPSRRGAGRDWIQAARRATSAATVASGDIVGASTLAFSQTGALTGTGAIVGASTLTFTAAATIQGFAPVSGSATLAFSPTGAISGIGLLTGATTLTFSPAATLTGSGALSGTTSLTFSPTATLIGTGAISGTTSITFTATGVLADSAAGNLTGSSLITFTAVGAVTGTGDLAGSTTLTFSPAGVLTDPGAAVTSGGEYLIRISRGRRGRRGR